MVGHFIVLWAGVRNSIFKAAILRVVGAGVLLMLLYLLQEFQHAPGFPKDFGEPPWYSKVFHPVVGHAGTLLYDMRGRLLLLHACSA